jgi:Zn-dependent protease with chaperone function
MILSRIDFPELLPGWIPWVAPLSLLVIVLVLYLAGPVFLSHRALRTDEAMPWTERARWFHVARVGTTAWMVMTPAVVYLLATAIVGPVSAISRPLLVVALSFLLVLAAILRSRKIQKAAFGPDYTWRETIGSLLLGAGPLLVLVWSAFAAPSTITSWWMPVWAAPVVGVVWLWTRGPLLIEKVGLAWPARNNVVAAVARAAGDANVPVPRVLELDIGMINAVAFPWLGLLAFSRRAADLFDDMELEAVAAHELAHLHEPKSMTLMRLATIYALVPVVAIRPLMGSLGFGALLVFLAFLAMSVALRVRARRYEHAADEAALQAAHRSTALGHALLALYRGNLAPAVLRRSTHGDLHERLRNAGLEPEYDIPAPPPRRPHAIATTICLAAICATYLAPSWLGAITSESTVPNQLATGLHQYGSGPAESLAWFAYNQGDIAMTASWLEVAAAEDDTGMGMAGAVYHWALVGNCDRAATVFENTTEPIEPTWREFALAELELCEPNEK